MGKNEFYFADIVLMKVGFISLQNVGIIDQCDITYVISESNQYGMC